MPVPSWQLLLATRMTTREYDALRDGRVTMDELKEWHVNQKRDSEHPTVSGKETLAGWME